MSTPSADSPSSSSIERQRRLSAFFASWGTSHEDLIASFDLLADECQWIQRPIPTLVGPRAARRFLTLARYTMGLATIDVEVLHMAENRHAVFIERIDHLRRADGSLIAAAPVTGVIDFDGVQITRWREYFDSLEFIGSVVRTSAVHGIKSFVRRVAKIRR